LRAHPRNSYTNPPPLDSLNPYNPPNPYNPYNEPPNPYNPLKQEYHLNKPMPPKFNYENIDPIDLIAQKQIVRKERDAIKNRKKMAKTKYKHLFDFVYQTLGYSPGGLAKQNTDGTFDEHIKRASFRSEADVQKLLDAWENADPESIPFKLNKFVIE